jgi:hypothetical protein
MAMDYTNSYASIVKYDKNDDGTLMVFGKATDDTLDLDSQICDPTWLDSAMPAWFKSGGNVREMHGPSAAGVAKEYEAKSDGHYIGVHVVDPLAVKKVETRVYQGFSIGIKSPRVVRDTKAANGRIIDGQIIEISLVDRPANPSAKLILAKSVDGESSLVQVEELHEYKAPLPSEVAKMTKKGSKMETIKQITELAKSLTPDTVKFDKDKFDIAIKAIADLIVVEANEITAGNTERDSIESLLSALKHLQNWYEGEVEEGEVSPIVDAINLGADADVAKNGCDHEDTCSDCGCDGCKSCKGCDSKLCKGCNFMAKASEADTTKCLECGCNQVGQTHGLSRVPDASAPGQGTTMANVSTAQIVTPEQGAGSAKSADADETVEEVVAEAEAVAEETVAEVEAVVAEETTEVSEGETSEDTSIEDVVEKAVKSAMESVKAEIEALRNDKEIAVEKSVKLESELATALTKTVAGGPKRTATAVGGKSNEYLVKAATYKAKADATTDPVLAKGYRALYEEFLAKADNPATENK